MTIMVSGCGGTSSSPPSHLASLPPQTVASTPAPASLVPTTDAASVRPGEPWIVYQGGEYAGVSRIRLVRPDGTGDHVLVDGLVAGRPDGWYEHPDWSHDGTLIAFATQEADGTFDIWVVNADGTAPHKVYDCAAPCGYANHPAWSPDDDTLVFETADHVGPVDSLAYLETLDVATGAHERFLAAADNVWFYGPRWAPDGHRIVVEAGRFATARFDEETVLGSTIGIVDLAALGPAFEPLLPFDSFAKYPDWHPTSDRIVLQLPSNVASPEAEADIAVIGLTGGAPTLLTDFGKSGGWAIQPTWSPDGARVWFVAEDRFGSARGTAASVLADGTDLQRLIDSWVRTHPRLRPLP